MLSPLDLMGPIGLITVLGLAPSASAYWYDDDEHREAKIAAWVVGMLAGTALITFAVWYSMRRRRAVLVGYASYRPPPPPGVVGYDVSAPSSPSPWSTPHPLATMDAARQAGHARRSLPTRLHGETVLEFCRSVKLVGSGAGWEWPAWSHGGDSCRSYQDKLTADTLRRQPSASQHL